MVDYFGTNSYPQGGVLSGNGDGTFGPLLGIPVSFLSWVQIADMNGDSRPDIVFGWSNGVGVLLNTTQVGPPQPDFQIQASGLSPTPVTAGSSATSTTTITPLHGFSGNVALSCTGLPSGASCSFSPASIAGGSGTSTLTLTTASSLQSGSYPFTVSGVSGSISRIAALTLTVESGSTPGFQIAATTASPSTVAAGSSATSTVSIAALNGFHSAVALICSSGISGVTCALNPSLVTPSGSSNTTSTLTISTTTAAAPGTYSVTITGTSGIVTHATSVTLTVAPDFTLGPASGSHTSQTISAGQSASFSLVVTPSASLTGTVNLTCAITPMVTTAPTCTLPSSVQISGGGAQPVAVSVGTTGPMTTSMGSHVSFPPGAIPLVWMLMLLSLEWLSLRSRKRLPLVAAPMLLAIVSWVGCGGSSSSSHTTPGTPPGTYTATVTASAGSVSHNTALQVVVQ